MSRFSDCRCRRSAGVWTAWRGRGSGGWLLEPLGACGTCHQDDAPGSSAAGGADARALEEPADAGTVFQGREGA